ncbi:replication factor C subunit 2-like [Homalodisca vitripennis]|nr:replication factor C subunit 2-like [Homalodisca vitripennis]
MITNIFKVSKGLDIAETIKLEFVQEIGLVHMRIVEGCNSLLQLAGLLGKLCQKANALTAQ